MADVEEQWRPEAEDVAETGLKPFATVDTLPNNGFAAMVSPKEGANGHGFDHNEDSDLSDILEFDDIGSNVDGTGTETGTKTETETGESSKNVGEVVEEEVVELEFEKLKPKLETHSMHCPNCKNEITKVTLRRKLLTYRPATQQQRDPVVSEPEPKPETPQEPLVGCLSCLSLFTCSGNGCFNPFEIFTKKQDTTISLASPPPTGKENEKTESCLSMFWVIRKGKSNPKPEDPEPSEPVVVNPVEPITSPTKLGSHTLLKGTSSVSKDYFKAPSSDLHQSPNVTGHDDTMINIENQPETIVVAESRGRPWLGYEGLLAEILKSIVYGGLMEVIASLSVVASTAASDAATLSIICVALASLIGGVIVLGHNLWDLRDDCYKDSSNNEAASKYKELLGQVNYFPLHAFFAILSFVVFGMVPPVAYGVSFHETNDKDYTIMVVAIASLLCVSLLALFKAYINQCTVFEYFKTMVYYITTAVSVSGVSYVAGNLLTRLMEEYGLFDMSSGGDMSVLPRATTQFLASF